MNGQLYILCVEDNDDDFFLVERELRKLREPFMIERAMDRKGYEKLLKAPIPDVILCDHNLPGFSSTEAFGILKERGLHVPFILVTATMGEDEGVRAINNGIDDYILKDRLMRLPSAVARAVRFARTEAERENFFNEIIRRERRFRALVENSTEAVVLCDEHLLVSYTSPSFPRIFRTPAESVRGKSILDLIDPSSEEQFYRDCQLIRERPGTPHTMMFAAAAGQGQALWIECVMNDLTQDEHVKAIVFNLRDTTRRVISQQSLDRTQAILSAIIENSSIGYVMVDPSFRVVAYNNEAILRYKLEFGKELTERSYIFDYLPEERREGTKKLYQNALNGEKFHYEISFPADDGTLRWYDVHVFPVYIPSQSMLGFIIATEEITARKTNEQEKDALTSDLLSKNKNLEQFSLIISHNLRAPVANILGLTRLLDNPERLNNDEMARCFSGISKAAFNIDQVIADLNGILQKQHSFKESKQTVDLGELLGEVLTLLKDAIQESGMTIESQLEVTRYHCIRGYMHSIFLNLISNGIKYRRPGIKAMIMIKSRKESDRMILEFIDNGLGIDLALHGDKMFGLYRKFHLHADGRGMGLYMVKTQAELMGGSVEAESRVDEGSTFRVTLPL